MQTHYLTTVFPKNKKERKNKMEVDMKFKPDETVVLKEWDELEATYGSPDGEIINVPFGLTKEMYRDLSDQELKISSINEDGVIHVTGFPQYNISQEMIKYVGEESNYFVKWDIKDDVSKYSKASEFGDLYEEMCQLTGFDTMENPIIPRYMWDNMKYLFLPQEFTKEYYESDAYAKCIHGEYGLVAYGSDKINSDEELKIIVGESLKEGYIDSIEGEIIKNAVDFSDILAKEIMTPRKDMVCLCAEDSYEENMKIVLETNHTRYPYYRDSKDNIIGMVHIRDLLKNATDNSQKDMLKLVRKMIIVPESAHISEILTTMKKQQVHTALVVDEYGGTAGLLTMEDIIEEVMGDIDDEHDLKIVDYRQISENSYEVDGKIDIESVEDMLGIVIEETNDHVTIGGYVFGLLGRLPEVGDRYIDSHSCCEFEVVQMDNARIKTLKITKLPQDTDSDKA